MKRFAWIGMCALALVVLFGGTSVNAASQQENEAVISHAIDSCRSANYSGDACQQIENYVKKDGKKSSTGKYDVSAKKGDPNSIYSDVVGDADLLSAITSCKTDGATCMAANYSRTVNPTVLNQAAQDCKTNGGVPVSSALGVPGNCVGGKKPDGTEKNPIVDMISILVRFATGLFGLILVLTVTYAGIRYIISGGNPDDVKEAKDRLKAAATGLVLFVLMSGLLQFILPPQFRIFG